MLSVLPRLGLLVTTVGGSVVSLGCCASLLGPIATAVAAIPVFEWVPLAWRLPLLYGSLFLALSGPGLGWRRHRRPAPLALFLPGGSAILYPLHDAVDVRALQLLVWAGLALLGTAAVWNPRLASRARSAW